MPSRKYTQYDSRFEELEKRQAAWDWGDQELDLDPEFSLKSDVLSALSEAAVGILGWYGRRLPVPFRLFGFLVLSKASHVEDALADTDRFKVPFGREMNLLAGPPVFGLGDDGDEHALQRDIMIRVIDTSDTQSLAQIARDIAEAYLTDGQGKIDAVDELIKPVLAEICFEWYGLKRVDPHAFMSWGSAISALIFGTPTGPSDMDQRRAMEGARRVKALVLQTLANPDGIPKDSIIGRLLALRAQGVPLGNHDESSETAITDARIVSLLTGMISGSAPTSLMTASHALRRVLQRRSRTFQARKAARDNDPNAMLKIVRECMRLRPATWPGVFRRVDLSDQQAPDFAGRRLRHKETVLVAVASALRDPAQWQWPHRFDPSRMSGDAGGASPSPDLAFGVGAHSCVGRWVAEDVTTAIMMALFGQASVRRSGRMRARGVFPATLPITYQPATNVTTQEMLVAAIPLSYGPQKKRLTRCIADRLIEQEKIDTGQTASRAVRRRILRHASVLAERQTSQAARADVRRALDTLDGNPAQGSFRKALENSGVVHTHSMSLATLTRKGVPQEVLLVEFNIDGPRGAAIATLSASLTPLLTDVIDALGYGGMTFGYLFSRFLTLPKPQLRGHSGVSFNGLAEWSVAQIEAERSIAQIAESVVDNLHPPLPDGVSGAILQEQTNPLDVLQDVRAKIRSNHTLKRHLFRTRSRAPAFARHSERSFPDAIWRWLKSPGVIVRLSVAVIVFAVIGYAVALSLGASGVVQTVLLTLGMMILSMVAVLAPLALTVWLLGKKLLRQEATDLHDNRYVPMQQHLDATRKEDSHGMEQNHFIAVNTLKQGLLRRVLMSLGFRLIAQQVVHWFRPGFVLDLGTIRHARWLRVKGTDQLIFQASFDGSWERYLEDFSDKVAAGQTLIWSNCEGFPKTKGFYNQGATDSERFKRWVRNRQVRTNLWYSRFGDMTNDRIRRNALISDGLARVLTREQAENWLRLFGSSPRNRPDVLETDEIQSIVFSGFADHATSACFGMQIKQPEAFKQALGQLLAPDAGLSNIWGDLSPLEVSFGTGRMKTKQASCTVGFSAKGLVRMGLPSEGEADLVRPRDFPLSFAKGMRRQARVLGDPADQIPDWTDMQQSDEDAAVDFVMLLTVPEPTMRSAYHAALLRLFGTSISESVFINTGVSGDGAQAKGLKHRHIGHGLGFRDGISQPRLLGSPGVSPSHPDAIKAGEIVLGYKDERNLIGPSPAVPAGWDVYQDLPDAGPRENSSWPNFAAPPRQTRDFGRNGTFLVLRQLEEMSNAFRSTMQVNAGYIGADWAAEKCLGRRRDGVPLDGGTPDESFMREWQYAPESAEKSLGGAQKAPENLDFDRFDPHGYQTPLGSHVRRANPRNSLDGGAENAPGRNRHRLLRRGRRYSSGNTSGLLFGCLNASIERQFEFVQQTWINSKSFHGLWNESDPLLATGHQNRFSIPTKQGRVVMNFEGPFIKYRGGGYFFLPGRAALKALSRPRKTDI